MRLRDIVFDRDVELAFMPQIANAALKRKEDSLDRFLERNDGDGTVKFCSKRALSRGSSDAVSSSNKRSCGFNS